MSIGPDHMLLHAWLDGELLPERRAEIEAWLLAHPLDAATVRLWGADRDVLRATFDPVLDEPVPESLRRTVQQSAGQRFGRLPAWRWAAVVAVFALGGAVGAGLMWRLKPAPPAVLAGATLPWVQRAAVAHSVYVPEVRHPVEVKAQEEHLSRWLTKRLDVPVKLFDLRAQGFELVGGRLLPDASGPSAQLMYQAIATPATDASGVSLATAKPVRVTVYLRKPDSSTPAAFRYEQQGALGLFYWVEGQTAQGGPTGYALAGELPREKLLALAEAIYRQGASLP